MFQRIEPRWAARRLELEQELRELETAYLAISDPILREEFLPRLERLRGQVEWMASTLIEIVISEAQNEVRDARKWDFDIIPHRVVMKQGLEATDGRTVPVEDAFKDVPPRSIPSSDVPQRRA